MKRKRPQKKQLNESTFDLIDKISKEHCHKTFGYLDKNDLKNEIWAICLEKIKDFNKKRGNLEHFLRVSVKNRLVNRFKDITKSVRSPCPRCPFYDPEGSPSDCAKFGDDRHLCNKWRNYQLSIESRNSLLNSVEQKGERTSSDNAFNALISKEMKEIILSKLDKANRYDFEQLASGGKISKQRLKKLKRIIEKILTEDKSIIKLTVNGQDIGD
jgi:hypothetical protein